jgi:hypothetical protein
MVMERLIIRAQSLLGFASETEVAEVFHQDGVSEELAFLSIKGAKVLLDGRVHSPTSTRLAKEYFGKKAGATG